MRVVLAGSVAVISVLAATAPLASGAPEKPVVRAVIWPNLAITVSPKSVAHGVVVFKIRNRDAKPHEFSINGVSSDKISPHATIEMKVRFKKPSVYSFTLPDYQPSRQTGWAVVGGQLKVT